MKKEDIISFKYILIYMAILIFILTVYFSIYPLEPHFKIMEEECEGVVWAKNDMLTLDYEEHIVITNTGKDLAGYNTLKIEKCEQVEVDEIIHKISISDRECTENDVMMTVGRDWLIFCDDGKFVKEEKIQKQDLTKDWLEENCDKIDKNNFKCEEYQIEVWNQLK